MSTDNEKGLALAVSSSLFIGASFIVKKKGLKRAGASGVRAGEHHHHHLFIISLISHHLPEKKERKEGRKEGSRSGNLSGREGIGELRRGNVDDVRGN